MGYGFGGKGVAVLTTALVFLFGCSSFVDLLWRSSGGRTQGTTEHSAWDLTWPGALRFIFFYGGNRKGILASHFRLTHDGPDQTAGTYHRYHGFGRVLGVWVV